MPYHSTLLAPTRVSNLASQTVVLGANVRSGVLRVGERAVVGAWGRGVLSVSQHARGTDEPALGMKPQRWVKFGRGGWRRRLAGE